MKTLGALDRAFLLRACRSTCRRERVPARVRRDAVVAYYYGASFRAVAAQFGGRFSAVAAWRWWHALSGLFRGVRGPHAIVVADETSVHVGRRHRTVLAYRKKGRWSRVVYRWEARRLPASHVLWVVVDARTLRVLALHLSRFTTSPDCRRALAQARRRIPRRALVLHDRGQWYPRQCRELGLRHATVRGGRRNRIECWNRQLKHRLDRFWRAFPPNSGPRRMLSWIRAYSILWNATRPVT